MGDGDGGDSDGGGVGSDTTNGGGTRVKTPNYNPRFQVDTVLVNKIKTMKVLTIIKKATIISGILVTGDNKEQYITYLAKGACMSKCNHAYNHKSLSETANTEMFPYVSDGCH